MAELPEVGPWAKEKLDALARYLAFYSKVLKNQRWRTIYLDAYAGGGRAVIRAGRGDAEGVGLFGEPAVDEDARELIDGSPRVALSVPDPFDRYIFIDRDPRRAAELETLQTEFGSSRTVNVLRATAAEGIDWLMAQSINRSTHRGVAFLNPFGAGLAWESIQKLADTRLFEVVVNFPLGMALQRMLPNSGEVPEPWANSLTKYFGAESWFEAVYQKRDGGLFAASGYEKRLDYASRLLELYRLRLKSAFGYVSAPRLIRNTRGSPLYYLLWAGPHQKGLEGADYILTMGERLPRSKMGRSGI